MFQDHYRTLGVMIEASEGEIKTAYKKAARKYHPDKNKAPGTEAMFRAVKEACDFLLDPKQRKVYDEKWWRFRGKDGADFSTRGDSQGSFRAGGGGGMPKPAPQPSPQPAPQPTPKAPPIVIDLPLNLEEILGCVKSWKIARMRTGPNGRLVTEEKTIYIIVKPGWVTGTQLTYPQEGDQRLGAIPGDVIFVVRVNPHALFKPDGHDLRHTAKLPFEIAVHGGRLFVPTLGGSPVPLDLVGFTGQNMEVRLRGHGLPHLANPSSRGELVVSFEVCYPDSYTPEEIAHRKCLYQVASVIIGYFGAIRT